MPRIHGLRPPLAFKQGTCLLLDHPFPLRHLRKMHPMFLGNLN